MKKKKFNETMILKALDWAYERALTSIPFPGVDNSITLAQNYLQQSGTLAKQVNSLIRWQNTKAASIGFVTGLGGAIVLPVMVKKDWETVPKRPS